MPDNSCDTPLGDGAADPEAGQSEQLASDVRRGRMIVRVLVVLVFVWDFAMLRESDTAVGILLVDLCAAHFMWTGSRVAQWYFAARCSYLGIMMLPFALFTLDPALIAMALVPLIPGWLLIRSRGVSQFLAHQQNKKRQILAESCTE